VDNQGEREWAVTASGGTESDREHFLDDMVQASIRALSAMTEPDELPGGVFAKMHWKVKNIIPSEVDSFITELEFPLSSWKGTVIAKFDKTRFEVVVTATIEDLDRGKRSECAMTEDGVLSRPSDDPQQASEV
jgi:hypothetical protein